MNENIKAGADIHAGDGGYSVGTQEKYDEFVKGRKQSLGKMRIQELTVQARQYAWENETHWSANAEREALFEQKFAELIVGECMEQVWYTREDGINGNVSEVIKDRIKQHFGVEE